MGKVGNAFAFRPGTDAVGDLGSHCPVYFLAGTYRSNQAFKSFITQELAGYLVGKYVLCENGCDLSGSWSGRL
jgi:hypothetical protein